MVNSIIKNIIWAGFSILLVASCGSDDNPGGNSADLQGTWVGQCELISSTESGNVDITFSGNTFVVISKDYFDTNCSVLNSDSVTQRSSGTFVVGNSLTTTSGLTAKEIDVFPVGYDPEYDIYHISDGKLYFGDYTLEKDGSSPANRPVDLDFSWYFIKG